MASDLIDSKAEGEKEPLYVAMRREITALRAALKAIKAKPYGCVYCDSGVLRVPPKYPHARADQGHEEGCGFAMADAALAYGLTLWGPDHGQ